ncbi:MAG: DNA-directed RNA polymerase subunit beta', partial [Chloroflexi bacterium]
MEAKDFKALRISLASPEQIRSWSYGEVTKPETINYRRLRPEKDGLFCEAIFGPTRDWQCYCGKYKNVRYRGIICEKCGVEITKSSVRRERMGHIELAAPVAHVWYVRRVPSYLGILLDISKRNLDRVLYFAQYIITYVDEEARQKALKRLDEEFQKRKEELERAARETIAAIEARLEQEVSIREERLEEVRARFEEALNQAMDPLMKEAQRIEARINDQQGKPARTALIFGPTGTVIVQKGEVIGREHLVRLQETVQDKLAEVEAEIRTEQEREQARIQREIEQWRAGAADQIERVEIRLAEEIEALQARINQDREELLSLSQKDFLNESRYRALKSKWGQVFKAGMGAEAFYEILSNLDLDKMAEELWREIRTSKSKQRTKKAVKQLRVVEALRKSGNRPEWMILTVLPVIPPDLRPMVQLDGGRFAHRLQRREVRLNRRSVGRIPEEGERLLQAAMDGVEQVFRRHGLRQLAEAEAADAGGHPVEVLPAQAPAHPLALFC